MLIRIFFIFIAMLLSACATQCDDPAASTESKAETEAWRPVPKQAICTRDINEHGHPSSCSCDEGYRYDSQLYRCNKR